MKKALAENPPVIGFLGESSPQNTANTQRLWLFTEPTNKKNTSSLKANAFGFYAIKSNNVVNFKENSQKEVVSEFLHQIQKSNPKGKILIILDNSRSHHAQLTIETARELNINLVFIPPYSPYLNPIEFI